MRTSTDLCDYVGLLSPLAMENATLFDQMLEECQEDEGIEVQFTNAVNSKGEPSSSESLFVALILLQQTEDDK